MPGADPVDRLRELFLAAEDAELAERRKVERRREYQERHKQRRAGFDGPLCARLAAPRRLWPRVHQEAITAHVPIYTQRLERGQTTPLVFDTTEAGALRLCNAVPDLRRIYPSTEGAS